MILVDEAAAYSPSGSWFAFTARPASGGQGPDVWIWQAGWDSARPLTTDHRSVLGGWIGETIVASRFAAPDPAAGAEASVESFVVDPASGAVESFSSGPIWRPSVDPMGHFAVYWEGTVAVDPATYEPRPAAGRLVVARLEGGEGQTLEDQVTILDGPVRDFDARWDERGGRLALWVADHEAEGVGSLSAYPIDPSTGVDLDRPLLDDVLALPGISIGQGRLAWATPPGQGGEGSRLQVLAWSGPDAGTVSSAPGVGDAPVVVVR